VLLVLALLVRLAVLPATADVGLWVADERHYHLLASSLVEAKGFAFESGPTSLRPPLYPAMVAGTWQVTGGRSLQAIRFAQILLSVATAFLAFVLARRLYDQTAALWAAGIVAFYPSLFIASYLILTETLFTFLLLAHATLLVRLLQRPGLAVAAAAGTALGLAALTRSVLWPLPLLLVPLIAWRASAVLQRRVICAAVFTIGYLVVVTPWAVRNTRLQGVPVVVDTMGGLNLMMGNYEHTPHDRIWDAVSMSGERSWVWNLPALPPDGGRWTEGLKERWARQQAVEFMREHPGLTLWRAAIKFGDFWGLERDFVAGVQHGVIRPPVWVTALIAVTTTVAFPLVLWLAVLGVWLRPPSEWRAHLVLLLLVAVVCGLHTVVFGHPRYRLPLTPILAVYAGGAVSAQAWQWQRLRGGGVRSLGALATAALFIAIWVAQFAVRDWAHLQRLLAVTS